jgi:hypothetical protein
LSGGERILSQRERKQTNNASFSFSLPLEETDAQPPVRAREWDYGREEGEA